VVVVAVVAALVSACGDTETADPAPGTQATDHGTSEETVTSPPPDDEHCDPTQTGGDAATVTIASVTRNPAGHEGSATLNDEVATLSSTSERTIDLSGWTIEDGEGVAYTLPPGSAICQYAVISIHSGRGTDTSTDLFADWGWRWDDQGDAVLLRDAQGKPVATCTYTADDPALTC
jgi:competence protein ComEC